MPEAVRFKPIGVAHTSATDDEVRDMGKEIEYAIEVFPEFSDALEGIDGFSHLIVLFHFDKLRPEQKGVLKVKPKKFLRRGLSIDQLPTVGVFSLDSPSRPNPIGFSAVRFVARDGLRLTVRGLEAFDGTPILDIKPYTPERRIPSVKVPAWYSGLDELAKKRREEDAREGRPRPTH
ncbi:MAG TPA: tRNA (N6-threonylcarbamoyladenosine(37)-N6)-methyltransferase TrmO [Conexivisphaerales archaeon]|nr:tRNA (N6-threonylcarbamoyladenosine(37)-N6)-methyltransferase TrmO [Conexivisphaerales archaeon]